MQRTSLALIAFAAAAAAQDHILPLGFGSASGPPTSSYPIARLKDANFDGTVTAEEIHAFATTLPTPLASGVDFMTDGRAVVESGDLAFYFTDSENGHVLRCVDQNHNGVIDASEAVVFFNFGTNSSGTALFAPDTLGVHRDTATNRTRVYVALDNGSASSLGFTRGIHRLVDLNGDGDAMDNGEQSLFVSRTMGLTVPGRSGPVTINGDFWKMVRVLPGGKVIAYSQGGNVNGTLVPNSNPPVYTYSPPPDQNCWYGFTDNNGTAVPEVWFNASTLNDLPVHPDFDDPRVPSTALYPNWDIQNASVAGRRNNYARFCDIVPNGGLAGEHLYYLGSSYRTVTEGDVNLNGQNVAGLIYRVADVDNDQVIDSGEISLFCNISGQAHAGQSPVTFVNSSTGLPIAVLDGSTYGFATSGDGSVHFLFDSPAAQKSLVSMKDQNFNQIIDQGEVYMPYFTPTGTGGGYVPPFHPTLGPYLDDFLSLTPGQLPGPMPAGVTPVGDGCIAPSTGRKILMDAYYGAPSVGNVAFQVGALNCANFTSVFLVADFATLPTPVSLGSVGLDPTCFLHLVAPIGVGLSFTALDGRATFPVPFPNNASFVGIQIAFQSAAFDAAGTTAVPFYTSNALQIVVQP
jgi:hypothetical protein